MIWENIADEQTAMAALQSGEIDFYETPPIDLAGQLQADPNIKVEVLDKGGNIVIMRMNFLHKPFSEVKARQALLYLVNQFDFMKATFGNPKYYGGAYSIFGSNTRLCERREHRLVPPRCRSRQGAAVVQGVRLQR